MKRYSLLLISTFLLSTTGLSAATLGTFNINGTVTVTQDTIVWRLSSAPQTAEKAVADGATGIYAGLTPDLDGTIISIQNLERASAPVDPKGGPFETFTPLPFISFDLHPLVLSPLDINHIFEGLEGTTECLNAPAPGQECTPSSPITPGASPFSFQNQETVPNSGVISSSASFNFSGVTQQPGPIGTTVGWQGLFTSQFGTSYQQVLQDFADNGFITNTYSATITVFTVPIPEPATMWMIGLGLIAAPLLAKRFKKSRV